MNGKLIRQRRKELGMTLKELGEAIGVSTPTICRYETDKLYGMRIDTAFRLAEVLGVKVDDLVMGISQERK